MPTAPTPHLDRATERRLAVASDTDPRTIRRAYRGEAVRGMSGERARRAVREWLEQQQPTITDRAA